MSYKYDEEDPSKVWVVGCGSCNFLSFGFVKGTKLAGKGLDEIQVAAAPTSDNLLLVSKPRPDEDWKEGDPPPVLPSIPLEGCAWQFLPKIDQKTVFNKVFSQLANNGTIGIFPEGGSHDQGHLIPLKAGVTIMALGAAAQGTPVKVVCAGLTYLHAHQFRSKCVVQYGQPFSCPPSLVERYRTDPRGACKKFLEIVTTELKKVTVNTHNWSEKKALDHVRRLYQPSDVKRLTAVQYMAHTKKFCMEFEKIRDSPQAQLLHKHVEEYVREVESAGWKDKELQLIQRARTERGNSDVRVSVFMYSHLAACAVCFPLSFPGLVLNAPAMYLSRRLALKQQVKALKESKVKVGAYDVVASEMVKWGAVFTPALYLVWTVLSAVVTCLLVKPAAEHSRHLLWAVPVSVLLLLPAFSFYSIKLFDVWFFSWKKFNALRKRNTAEGKALLGKRRAMQERVKEFVRGLVEEPTGEGAPADERVGGNGDGGNGDGVAGTKVFPGNKVFPAHDPVPAHDPPPSHDPPARERNEEESEEVRPVEEKSI